MNQEARDGFRVPDSPAFDQRERFFQGEPDGAEDFVDVLLRHGGREVARLEDVKELRAEPGRAVELADLRPGPRLVAALLDDLALGRRERRLPRLQRAGRDLVELAVDRRPELLQQKDVAVLEDRNDGDGSRMLDDPEGGLAAVGQDEVALDATDDSAAVALSLPFHPQPHPKDCNGGGGESN